MMFAQIDTDVEVTQIDFEPVDGEQRLPLRREGDEPKLEYVREGTDK